MYRVVAEEFLNHKQGDIVKYTPVTGSALVKRGILEKVEEDSSEPDNTSDKKDDNTSDKKDDNTSDKKDDKSKDSGGNVKKK